MVYNADMDFLEYFENQKSLDGNKFSSNFFALDPETFNSDDNTIKVRYTNNNKVLRYSYARDEYFHMVLSSAPGAVDLTRLNNGAAVVDSHNTSELSKILGAVVPGSATESEATIKFSTREEVKPLIEDIKAGIIRFVSPGFFIHETKDVTQEGDKYRTLEITKWEPYEISFVASPADPQAQTFNLAGCQINEKQTEEQKQMEPKEPIASAALDIEKIKAEAIESEKNRADEIFKIAIAGNLGNDFAVEKIKSTKSIDEIRKEAFDALAEKSKKFEVNSNIAVGETQSEKTTKAAMSALEARAGYGKFETGNQFNNMRLMEMAKFFASSAGANIVDMTESKIAEFAMHSTSDFPNILANVANKTLRRAYDETERTFLPFCRRVTLNDFKPVNRVQLSEVPTPTIVTEGGEFKQASVSDGKESYSLSTYGEVISITRQTIINDDLSAFGRIPSQMGSAAARLESDIVYAILTGNPNMADGNALFSVAHTNLTDALLLNYHATLNYFKHFVKMFRTQKQLKGSPMNLYPKYLIVGPELEVDAKRMLQPISADSANNINIFANLTQLVVDPRITDSSYYGAESPNVIDTIEYAYLTGEEGPQITTQNGFLVDGVQIKMKLDFAAKAIDWRGLGKSTNNDT
jgi:hypothetical protein